MHRSHVRELRQEGATTTSTTPIAVALVGCGAVAEMCHAPALAQGESQGRLRVTRLVDPNAARIAALRRWFPHAAAAPLDDLAGAVELAIVASPVRFHAPQTIALLERGVHVLCEKPVARHAAEADAMIVAATRAHRLLAVGQFRRFFPAVRWIGEVVTSGLLGRLERFHLDEGGRFGWPAVTAAFFDREQAGGGVTMDIGIHMLDIALQWFGEPESFTYADDAYGGIEANARGTLRGRDGVAGTFRLSWDVPLSGTYALDFERGWIRWPTNSAHTVHVGFDGTTLACDARLASPLLQSPRGLGREAPRYQAAFTAQLFDVVDAIRESRPPTVTAESAAAPLRLIERMYAGREVWLPSYFTDAERRRARELAGGAA